MFEKGSFPWGEIGAWLLEIGREIPSEEQREARNKGAVAGWEASRELNCQRFEGGEQQELRAQILAGA